jgi:FkbM family methyltransferase
MFFLNKIRAKLKLKHRIESILPQYVQLNANCGIFADRGFRLWVTANPNVYSRLNNFLEKIVGPDDSFIDCGASFGWVCFPVASRIRMMRGKGKVLAVEADKKTFRFIQKSFKKNNFDSNFIIQNLYVGDSSKRIDFYSCSASGMSGGYFNGHIKELIEKNNESLKIQKIQSTTIDYLVEKYDFQNIAAIKLDIEGGELPALRGCINLIKNQSNIVFIVEINPITFHAAGYSVKDVWEFFENFGYKIFTFASDANYYLKACRKYNEIQLIDAGDIIAVQNESILHEKLGNNLFGN